MNSTKTFNPSRITIFEAHAQAGIQASWGYADSQAGQCPYRQ